MKYGRVKVIWPGKVGRILNLMPAMLAGTPGLGSLPLWDILDRPRPEVPAAILGPPINPALVIVLAIKCACGPGSGCSSSCGGSLLFWAQEDM